jgi:hypothetical protein
MVPQPTTLPLTPGDERKNRNECKEEKEKVKIQEGKK